MNKPWQYDESIQVGTDYRNIDEVRKYDERMQTLRNVRAEVDDILNALQLTPDSTVWEIGTGTAECAIGLAPSARQVYAVDVSPTMLAYARQKAEQRGITNITFADGGFLTGFEPPQPVDAVVSQLALHHLPDFWKARALDRIARTLRPGGQFFLRDVVFPSNVDDYDSYFENALSDMRAQAGDAMADPLARHIRREYSTLDWILEGLITRAGLSIIRQDDHGILTVYLCTKTAP